MSEGMRFEKDPSSEVIQEDEAKLDAVIEQCFAEREFFITEDTLTEDIDYVLSKYIESGAELDPTAKESLRRTIERKLGIKYDLKENK